MQPVPLTSAPRYSEPRSPGASTSGSLTRRGRILVTVSVLAVLVTGAVAWVLLRTQAGTVLGLGDGPPCRLTVAGEQRKLSREQAMTATTIVGVGQRIGATRNGVAAALDRAMPDPATDSQRDAPALNAAAARAVYRTLPDVARPGPASLARAGALMGDGGPALTCAQALPAGRAGLAGEAEGPRGLTPRAERTRAAMRAVFGPQKLGGFARGGVRSGHITGSAHYEGRAVDVFFRPLSPQNTRRGWLLAQWSVAHADSLDLATVIFDRRIWTAARSGAGWRDYQHPDGPTDNPILLHRDHVHVDVLRGSG